jgi:hypothetical protein
MTAAGERRSTPDMVTFTEIAKRLHERGIVDKKITRQGVRHIADTDPEWPIPADQWLKIGNAWVMDWEPVEKFFQGRDTKGRGPNKQERKPIAKKVAPVDNPGAPSG